MGVWEVRVPMAGLFDVAAERARLERDRQKLEAERGSLAKKFENPNFVERAKPEVVTESRARMSEIAGLLLKIDATLRELGEA